MPSTYTTNLGVEKPGSGEKSGTWGGLVNDNMDIVDRAINGAVSLTLVGATSTLTTSDGALSDGQNKLLRLSGSPGGTHTITVSPNDAQKIYFVTNGSDQSVVFSQGSGANVTVLASNAAVIYCNGAGPGAAVLNMLDALAMGAVRITGGTIAGITDLAVADGGTGASTPAAALTNLGLTATAAELNILDGVTASAAELNALDGISADTAAFLAAADNAAARTALGVVNNATHTGEVTGATALTITNAAVTNAKLAPMVTKTLKGNGEATTLSPADLAVYGLLFATPGFIGVPVPTQLVAETGTDNFTAMTPLRTRQAIPSALNATGAAPIYAVRAWGNFNGDTVATRASGNLSIARTGTGDFTFTIATAMPDANYSVNVSCAPIFGLAGIGVSIISTTSFTASFRRIDTNVAGNPTQIFAQVVR